MGDLAKAQTVFEEMLEQAKLSHWQRSAIHAKNWLAYTAILQNQCALGEQYLQMGWPIAERIKEKRVHAYYKRTFAYYYDRDRGTDRGAQVGERCAGLVRAAGDAAGYSGDGEDDKFSAED